MEWQEEFDSFVRKFKIFGLNMDPDTMKNFSFVK